MPSSERRAVDRGWAGPIPSTLSPYPCIEFVNSRFESHIGTGEVYDRLEMPEWRAWFLERSGLRQPPAPTPETLTELRHVRTQLRELLQRGARPAPRTMSWINDLFAASPAVWQLRGTGAGVEMHLTRAADWSGVIAAVLQSYGELLESGGIDRVRECANPHCTWLFYDKSRNGTRRWCDPQACGNLHNVHAHRRRSRAQHTPRRV
jgi:predicted RNA-binding Zn ribbon-like protein